MIRVLLSDPCPDARGQLRKILETDPDLAVLGEAANGPDAAMLAKTLGPEIIVMDMLLAKDQDYGALRRIMEQAPRPVIVLSESPADCDPQVRHPAVEAGALMVAAKPKGLRGFDPAADLVVAYVKAMAHVKVVHRSALLRKKTGPDPAARPGAIRQQAVEIIAIGASTGGPPALQAILCHLGPRLRVPVVAVQHISRGFVSGLARWLAATTPHAVEVAEENRPLDPGGVYLAPDDRHLLVSREKGVFLSGSEPVDGHVPSVTALFLSVAASFGSRAAGVLLTGMGRDGARGLKALREAGALTICQDAATSVVWGMPREAAEMGAAEFVLPLARIGPALRDVLALRWAGQVS